MTRRRDLILFEGFLALLILIFIGASFHYSQKARLVPLVVGFFAFGLTLYQIIADILSRRPEKGDQGESSEAKYTPAILFALGCGVLMILFGYYGCMGIVLLGLTRFWFKESWWVSFAVTACLLVFSYILFNMIFGIVLSEGVIPSFVLSFFPE